MGVLGVTLVAVLELVLLVVAVEAPALGDGTKEDIALASATTPTATLPAPAEDVPVPSTFTTALFTTFLPLKVVLVASRMAELLNTTSLARGKE